MEKFKGALLVGALRLFALLPWRAVQAVGSAIGWIMWKTPNRSRDTVRINLSKCFPDMDPAERERLATEAAKAKRRRKPKADAVATPDENPNQLRLVA